MTQEADRFNTAESNYKPGNQRDLSFPRGQTALLVIDPVNDFLSEGGAAWEMTKSTVKTVGVVENLKRAIQGAREHGVPVLLGPMAFTEEDYAEHNLQRLTAINRVMFEHKMFLAGSWGADFHPELQPQQSDIILKPHKVNDVFGTDLPEHLERLGITHLVIAGMTANLCVESTGRHAAELGYDVTYLTNAIGSESMPSYEAAVHVNYPLIGNVTMQVDEFLLALAPSEGASNTVQVGDTVLGSDHGEIGTVQEIIAATEDAEAHLIVPRGVILHKDMFIPLDAVVRRAGTTVFVNVPKLIVGNMPWSERPLHAKRREHLGPRAVDVTNVYGSKDPSGS
ncbi:cysteine hydrolase family protein [Deinococcus peraridilitoris]|uniref:Nicotinamidase-like amidase n=1 Tax=Deinococcus peraridilitoris (strain DSM 19664 / LMG 22246 / CIP 109416 / KR-200) TaxID=937777 RepID=L0A810_DEIPD|nr:isochorismatase family cysteine hydrolase [Deinococcus peraridilitoris]AFZ69322.1 nicotinamidase-like amidase [Deinococcus peraridilitoris DSM 19664]